MRTKLSSPYWVPVWFFAAAILSGALLLHFSISHPGGPLTWLDALFTATSAICVTGLIVVDTGSHLGPLGQGVVLVLMQLGGLGIMTFTSLLAHLLGRRVTLGDRIAVGQSLLHDPAFSLGGFLARVVCGVLALEAVGAVCLHLLDPDGFPAFSAVFHAVSAFCNAGFSLQADSLSAWRGDVAVNLVFMALIVLGGLGFHVLNELAGLARRVLRGRGLRRRGAPGLLTWHTRVVLATSAFLILGGAAGIFLAERLSGGWDLPLSEQVLVSFFQSVTCRTAGFNTVDVAGLSNVSLLLMIVLMGIGGSPGSCAGGVKTTTFRAWIGFVGAQIRGRSQARIQGTALTRASMNKALTLSVFAFLFVLVGLVLLTVLEGGAVPHTQARGQFMETLFETMSAFGTVGLSTGMTDTLSGAGKVVVIVLMFVGRLGPMWLLAALQSWQREPAFRLPEDDLPMG